jgi:ligand-binding sensor domain-containing protein
MILSGRYRCAGVLAAALQLAVCLAATRTPPRVVAKLSARNIDGLLGSKPLDQFRDIIRSIAAYKGELYVGTYGRGLYVFPLSSGPLKPARQFTHQNSPLAENRVNCLEVLGDELWLGTCDGIDRYDGKRWRHDGLKEGVAHTIYHVFRQDSRGRLWIGTTGKGISLFEAGRYRTYDQKSGLPSGWINDIQEDGNHQMWAATAGGLARFVSDAWQPVPPRGNAGHIWSHATALAVRGPEIWVGTGAQGLLMYQQSYWYSPGSDAPLSVSQISSLLLARDGTLWIGTSNGLMSYRSGHWKTFGPGEGLDDLHVMVMKELVSPPSLWLGSYKGHLYRYQPEENRWTCVFKTAGGQNK